MNACMRYDLSTLIHVSRALVIYTLDISEPCSYMNKLVCSLYQYSLLGLGFIYRNIFALLVYRLGWGRDLEIN